MLSTSTALTCPPTPSRARRRERSAAADQGVREETSARFHTSLADFLPMACSLIGDSRSIPLQVGRFTATLSTRCDPPRQLVLATPWIGSDSREDLREVTSQEYAVRTTQNNIRSRRIRDAASRNPFASNANRIPAASGVLWSSRLAGTPTPCEDGAERGNAECNEAGAEQTRDTPVSEISVVVLSHRNKRREDSQTERESSRSGLPVQDGCQAVC
jgi:hypothetical protein